MTLDLPTLPGTQARALALAGQDDVGFKELAAVVETDPALTTAVLRAANSALSAPIGRIETAEQALVRIGIQRTRHIVAGAVVAGGMSNLRRAGIDTDELWRHLVACALIADVTAWGDVRRSAAFTAALLHDLGRMAMAQSEPAGYAMVVDLVREGADILHAEEQVFGVTHAALGAEAARAWNISNEIAEAIGDHHYGVLGPLSWVVWNSRKVVWSLGIGDGVERPVTATFDSTSEDAAVIASLGGPEKFRTTVAWYTGAMTSAVTA